ncbi:hypothetical protein HQ571_03120 [Candidatus Kuenenbacteria bacterium]|nr:hypothetical protein [Candidatus Kuenenbacteria bacterium]
MKKLIGILAMVLVMGFAAEAKALMICPTGFPCDSDTKMIQRLSGLMEKAREKAWKFAKKEFGKEAKVEVECSAPFGKLSPISVMVKLFEYEELAYLPKYILEYESTELDKKKGKVRYKVYEVVEYHYIQPHVLVIDKTKEVKR